MSERTKEIQRLALTALDSIMGIVRLCNVSGGAEKPVNRSKNDRKLRLILGGKLRKRDDDFNPDGGGHDDGCGSK